MPFIEQVNSIMVREMLHRYPDPNVLIEPERTLVASITRSPSTYGFPSTIVKDSAWGVGFDLWAENPEAQEGAIMGAVTKYFTMLTGLVLPDPP